MIAIFDVHGIPGPQGSKRHVGGGRMVESSAKVKPWRDDVRAAAERWRDDNGQPPLLDGPLVLRVEFRLRRPKSAPKRIVFPATTPDLSKLIRSTEDALTGIIWTDDARVVRIDARKVFAQPGDPTGAYITVWSAVA